MQFIEFKDLILLPNRQRRDFDEAKLEELAESIRDKGLMHAPVVRNDGRTLVAGERRSKAMAYLSHMKIPFMYNGQPVPLGQMPVVHIGDLTPLQVREAELEENLCRVDLSWQEESMAMAELTELRRMQDPSWTPRDTAREIDDNPTKLSANYEKTRNAELLKNYMDDPDVLKAKSSKEAVKIIRKKVQAKTNAILAEVHRATDTRHTIINKDMREVLIDLPDESFDVIITDPPYGINADDFGGQAKNEHEYDDTEDNAIQLVNILAHQGFRFCKKQAHAYVFCDIRLWPKFSDAFRLAGWYVWPVPLIWVKRNGMLPRPEHGPRRCYEAILYAIKGSRKVNAVYPDTLVVQEVIRPQFGAEKPSALYYNLLRRSVMPGDTVIDPFAGAGPIFGAANGCDVTATAIEINKEKHDYMLLRIDEKFTDQV